MPKFAVLLHGRGCRIEVDQGRWVRRKPKIQTMGFYTTRFVDCSSAEEAVSKTTEMVREELRNSSIDPPEISVESVLEDEAGYDQFAPGGGFTWYKQERAASETIEPNSGYEH
jgi:hypothetical protein